MEKQITQLTELITACCHTANLLVKSEIALNDGEVDVSIREIEYEFKRIVKDCIMLKFPTAITQSYESGQE